jgi:hypothetical protein
MRSLVLALVLVALVAIPSGAWPPARAPRLSPASRQPAAGSIERRYRMAARIRPLLVFWITRENVGGARIVWLRRDDGMRGWELLIGSDPLRAPMRRPAC